MRYDAPVPGRERARSGLAVRQMQSSRRCEVSVSPDPKPAAQLEDLVREYGHVIRAAVRKAAGTRLTRFGPQADDVFQSVLLEVWKQVLREQEIRFPSSYLYRAAVRETVRLMRRHQNRQEDPLGSKVSNVVAGPGVKSDELELREAIEAGLGALQPERRKAVEHHLAGYKVGEIMRRFDWSYSRARNLIARGMADLRQRLRSMGIER